VNRREVLKTAGTLGAGVAASAIVAPSDPDDTARLLAALANPERNLSEQVINVLERNDRNLQRHDRSLRASSRIKLAREHLHTVRRLRPSATRPDWQVRLAVVEAQAARLAGRLAANWLQDRKAAVAGYRIALAAAHDAGPHAMTLRAYTLGGMAFLDTRLGERRAAVHTIAEALEAGESSGVQGLRCWLASTAATVHAGVGDRRACDRALKRADDLFTLPSAGDPVWMDFLSRGFLLEDRAACQLRIGQPRQALTTLTEAERLVAPHRLGRRALVLAYRAEALVQDGQLGDGSGVAIEALDLAMRIGYRRVVEQVRTLRPDGLNRAPTLPAVKELDERLRRNPMEM